MANGNLLDFCFCLTKIPIIPPAFWHNKTHLTYPVHFFFTPDLDWIISSKRNGLFIWEMMFREHNLDSESYFNIFLWLYGTLWHSMIYLTIPHYWHSLYSQFCQTLLFTCKVIEKKWENCSPTCYGPCIINRNCNIKNQDSWNS